MILDNNLVFSDAQAVTASAASTNTLDLGVSRDIGPGEELPMLIQVMEDFATLTSLTVEVQTDDSAAFTTPVSLASQTIAAASLKAGTRSAIQCIPVGTKRYLRLYYTVTGANATAGKVTAALTVGEVPNWKGYASGFTV